MKSFEKIVELCNRSEKIRNEIMDEVLTKDGIDIIKLQKLREEYLSIGNELFSGQSHETPKQ